MGNSYSGLPKPWDGVNENNLNPASKEYFLAYKHNCQVYAMHRISNMLQQKVPGYFQDPPLITPVKYPPKPPKSIPLPRAEGPNPPPAPSFSHFHPLADLLRRHLFLHLYSDEFLNAAVERSKLFVGGGGDGNGDGDGKLRLAYVHVINIRGNGQKVITPVLGEDGEEEELSQKDAELLELQSNFPTLHKLRILIKTSLTTSHTIATHAQHSVPDSLLQTRENVRIMELRAEITGFDKRNQAVRPPGSLGIGAKLFGEQEKEMGKFVVRKEWGWCVQQLREICLAVLGLDGGVFEFIGGGWENRDCEVEGEEIVRCFVVREGGVS